MEALKIILIAILSIFGVYLFFRIAGLAIAKSWRQIMACKDCRNEQNNKKKEQP